MQFHLSYLISKEETITFYNLLLAERLQLEKRIQKLQKQINNYPKEQFICTTNGKYHKWYQSDGKTATYIPKNNRHLAEQLCTKKYLTLLIQDLSDEIQAIDSYLAKNSDYVLYAPVDSEACCCNLAPTVSTTVHLVMGDALAVALEKMNEFTAEDFAKVHPGGTLGEESRKLISL